MTTSRTDSTKFEHFAQIVNDQGEAMDLYMRHDPAEALYSAMELGQHLGIPTEPLVIDGVEIELDGVLKRMLDKG